MGLGPIELNVSVSRAQDFAAIRHNEEHKGMLDQANFSQTFKSETEEKSSTVEKANDVSNYQKQFDAKEKGNGEYHGDGGQHRHKDHDEEKDDGKVVKKTFGQSFDIRI